MKRSDSCPDIASPKATPWRTLNEAAQRARVSAATVRREAKSGRLRGYKVGGRRVWRFKAEDIDAWFETTNPGPNPREVKR